MKREIKFRAKSLEGGFEYFDLHSSITVFEDDNVFYCNGEPCEMGSEQQYTGLKDKNGKEIYYQDLLKDKRGNISCVYWSDRDAGWYHKPPNDNTHDECWHRNLSVPRIIIDGLEKVGTFFENPELLKGK